MSIGQRIKKIRKLLDLSQQELADELKITKQAISNMETGKSTAGINVLSKLLLDYNVNLNFLVGGKGSVFLDNEDNTASLKNTILKEVEKMLEERGIN